jgi:hypothetical protein
MTCTVYTSDSTAAYDVYVRVLTVEVSTGVYTTERVEAYKCEYRDSTRAAYDKGKKH